MKFLVIHGGASRASCAGVGVIMSPWGNHKTDVMRSKKSSKMGCNGERNRIESYYFIVGLT